MIHSLLRVITVSLILIGGAAFLFAQTKTNKPLQRQLAVKVVDDLDREPYPVTGPPPSGTSADYVSSVTMGVTKPLPDFERPKSSVPMTGIKVRYVMEGEAVRVKVAVIFDDTYPANAPGPKYGPVEKAIASYLVREGETLSVKELEELGYEPLLLKIVHVRFNTHESRRRI